MREIRAGRPVRGGVRWEKRGKNTAGLGGIEADHPPRRWSGAIGREAPLGRRLAIGSVPRRLLGTINSTAGRPSYQFSEAVSAGKT